MANPPTPSLAELAAASGVAVRCAGNLPLDMHDPRFVWFVAKGAADVFLIEHWEGREQAAPQHLARVAAGRLLPGVAPPAGESSLSLMAKGLPGTLLRRLPAASLAATLDPAELAAAIDLWIMDVSAALSRDVAHRPSPDILVETGQTLPAAGGAYSARRGVAWLRAPAAWPDAGLFMDLVEVGASDSEAGGAVDAIPLTPASWLALPPLETQLTALSTATLAEQGLLLPALTHFHAIALSLERVNRRLAIVDQVNLAKARAASRRTDEENARGQLFNLYDAPQREAPEEAGEALREVLRAIGGHEGIDFKWPARTDTSMSAPALVDILDLSEVRARRVRLPRQGRWWAGDSGAMLGFRENDGRPVALLPGALGRYRMIDPAESGELRLTARRAASLRAEAWLFYRPLKPAGIRLRELFRAAGKGLGGAFARLALAGLLGGLIALMPAVLLGFIVNRAIPDGAYGLVYLATATLAGFAVIWALLHVLQGMALMRVEANVASRIEAAFWDRLFRLPSRFLQRYPAGDRAMRGMTFQRVFGAVQGAVANDALSVVFLLPALAAIFFHDAALGGVAAAIGLLALLVTVALGLRQMRPHARAARASRGLAGLLLQIINGIPKLRIDGAEGSAFAAWAREYREQQRAELELGAWKAHLRAFGAGLPPLAGAALLLAAALRDPATLAIGDFLFIYAAFALFVTGLVRLGASLGAIVATVPEFAQIEPFLAETAETDAGKESVEHLGGDIRFDRVSFRYDADGPLILDDVSIRVRPGEFIAIAGESGSGKSTLFRLALGLDQPTSGAIYYDGRDLGHLNARQLRRKIGVVPQEVSLHPQDLWENIAGAEYDASAQEVWRAARTASIDEEITAMPMKLQTCVGDSSSVLSGGESQRVMIARALMRNPRILLLDEATNWLDNDSQSRIMGKLAQMSATRIVIAHRLSTLREADRVYVMQSGRIVQEGAYAELAAVDGAFRNLVSRQET